MTTKSLLFLLLISIVIPFVSAQKKNQERIVFITQINPGLKARELSVFLNWNNLSARMGKIEEQKIQIIDLNNNKEIPLTLISNHKKIEGVSFTIGYDKNESLQNSNESIRTFELRVSPNLQPKMATDSIIPKTGKITTTYLTEAKDFIASHKIKPWSETIANTILATYPNPADMEVFSKGKWSYTNGYFLNALSECYLINKNSQYFDYIKQWVNLFLDATGRIDPLKYKHDDFELDNIAPGRLLLFLYQQTSDNRYAKAADQLLDQLNHQPRTSDGGFWHKKLYTNQMWLDGIYMADVFLAQYASAFNKSQYFDEAAKQMELIFKHTYDPKTGLLFHGWDESKNKIWADPLTGASPEIWGRALGWYLMAVVDGLDYIPNNHPEHPKLVQIFKSLAANLIKYQDTTSGLWYQVVNKGNLPGNWLETSCSAMFAYALAKGVQSGYLGNVYLQRANKAFDGLVDNEIFFDDQGKIYVNGTVKVGTLNLRVSKGDYDYYIGVDRRINDFKGIAAFFYLALILNK
jgi:unsaturated rhamnogalacturonyl hydrolase